MAVGITATLLENELAARGLNAKRIEIDHSNVFMFDYLGKLRVITGVTPDLSSATSRIICNNKDLTERVAKTLGIPVPEGEIYADEQQAAAFLHKYKRIVLKPTNGAHGNGITTNITSVDSLQEALTRAHESNPSYKNILLQQQIEGNDYRVLVVGGEAIAIAERVPAYVFGDGVQTIEQLIEDENTTNPKRGANYEKTLNYIDSEAASTYLGNRMNDIPKEAERVQVVGTANIGTGGSAINRTGDVPVEIVEAALKIATAIGAFTCGVDFMYDRESGAWYLIEMNGSPSFGLHVAPSEGEPIDVTKMFIDMLLAAYDNID